MIPTTPVTHPGPARPEEPALTVLVGGRSPAGGRPLRSLVGRKAAVDLEGDLARALERCLGEPVDLLFVNLFGCDASQLTALSMFRQARPDQYVAACVDEAMVEALEHAGLADAMYVLEEVELKVGSSLSSTPA